MIGAYSAGRPALNLIKKGNRVGDETHYQVAAEEYDNGQADKGLMAKAYVAADGAENRIKIEYMKLRVGQLKGGRTASIHTWYRGTSNTERTVCFVLSVLFIPLFGIGLIALVILAWLSHAEDVELARQARQDATPEKPS
jgi:hypothetical protein